MLAALGLRWADMFAQSRGVGRAPEIIASYEYVAMTGELVARKLRYSNKTFRWQRPGKEPDTWLWKLNGVTPGLYRLPELRDCPQVFICEGEKAVDLLWSLGLPATCGPSGAASWLREWSRDLAVLGVREVVILPDADRPGQAHAERVAATTCAESAAYMTVKLLELPGLPTGADVFDWLTSQGAVSDLVAAAIAAPKWTPGAREAARVAHKQAMTRARQRRFRLRHHVEIVKRPESSEPARVLEYRARKA